jgi:hypothetical protein
MLAACCEWVDTLFSMSVSRRYRTWRSYLLGIDISQIGVVGISQNDLCLTIYFESREKFFITYQIPVNGGAGASRGAICGHEHLVQETVIFDRLKTEANKHELIIVNQTEYNKFYERVEKIWLMNTNRRAALQNLMHSIPDIGATYIPPERTHLLP